MPEFSGHIVADSTPALANFEARLCAELNRRMAAMPAMLHSINEAGLLVSVSDAWLAKLGYAREEVLGRRSTDFLTPESRERALKQVVPEFFHTGNCDNIQYRMVKKDGGVIDVLMSAVLADDPSGRGRVSLAVITDITALVETKRELRASEARYRSLIEDQTELVSLARPDGELRYVNPAYAAFYGQQQEAMIGKNLLSFVPKEERAAIADHLQRVCQSSASVEHENQVVLPGGEKRWLAWTNRALRDGEGRVTVIHSVGRDVQSRVDAERRLQESEARYRLLADNGTDMVFRLDRTLTRRYVSPACREILGYEPEELIGTGPMTMAHPEDAARLELAFGALLHGGADRLSIAIRTQHRDGRWVWVDVQLRALKDPKTQETTGIIGASRDISARMAVEDELAEANRRLQALAGQDALTGLANRRTFDETLAREYSRAAREGADIALIMIDVDHFKAFNDRYGHPAGDECLRRIAGVIAQTVRRPGDIAARYGGEEFAVILPATGETGAIAIAERLRQAVLDLGLPHAGVPHGSVTISVGIAAQPSDRSGNPPEALLHAADQALYFAKAKGRNRALASSGLAASEASATAA